MKSQSFHTSRATFSDFYFRRWSDFQRVLALIALKLDPPAFSDPIRLLDWCFPGFSLAGYYRFFDGQHASHVAKHAGLAGTLVLSIVDIEKLDSPQNRHVTAVTLCPKLPHFEEYHAIKLRAQLILSGADKRMSKTRRLGETSHKTHNFYLKYVSVIYGSLSHNFSVVKNF